MARKAGDKLLAFQDYLGDYDRTAYGAGSQKDTPTDRLSGYDIKKMMMDGKSTGANYIKRGEAVLDYFDENKDNTLYGQNTLNKLDKLRAEIAERKERKANNQEPEPTATQPVMPEIDQGVDEPMIEMPGDGPATQPGDESVGQPDGRSGGTLGGNTSTITTPIAQDNDFAFSGNNSGTIDVNNSINQNFDQSDNRRYYEGDSRHFEYNGGTGLNSLYDSPVSMATMGGYYDVSDSPAATAKFLDLYIDSNNLMQKDMQKNYNDRANTDYSANASPIDFNSRLNASIQGTKDAMEASKPYGDMSGYTPKFMMPDPPAPIESDTDEIFQNTLAMLKK